MSRAPRFLALALAAAAAALALAAPLAGAGGVTASATACRTPNLVLWLQNGLGNGTAGSIYYTIRITNESTAPCTFAGYPRVTAVGLRGQAIGKPAEREPGQQPKPVTLTPGESAKFQLRVVEAGNFPGCHPARAAGWRIAPPGGGGAKVVPFPFETCAKKTVPVLGVGPVRPG
jgi:hypothetical protein